MGWAKPDRSLLRPTRAPESPQPADDDLLAMRDWDLAVGCLVCPAGEGDACSGGGMKFSGLVHRARQDAGDKILAATINEAAGKRASS